MELNRPDTQPEVGHHSPDTMQNDDTDAQRQLRQERASGPAPSEDITNRTSSAPSDMAKSAMQECNVLDTLETTRQSAQKRPVSPTATERESTAIKRQAKVTSDETSSSTITSPTKDEHRRTTQSVPFPTKMLATAEASATPLCDADIEEIRKEDEAAKVEFDKAMKKLKEAANWKKLRENQHDA